MGGKVNGITTLEHSLSCLPDSMYCTVNAMIQCHALPDSMYLSCSLFSVFSDVLTSQEACWKNHPSQGYPIVETAKCLARNMSLKH